MPTSSSSAAARPGAAGVLAGRGGPRRGHRREEAFPREKTCGDGLTPGPSSQLADMGLEERLAANHHRYDGLRAWPTASPSSCAGPSTRSSRATATSCAGATSTRWWPSTPSRPGHAAPGHRGAPPDPARGPARAGAVVKDKEGEDRARSGPLRGRRRRRQLPLRPGPRQPARQPPTPRAWRSGATSRARCTPSRGSSPPSTSATATATPCPATAGSSPSATGPSTWASACCRPSATGSRSTPRT